MLDIQNKINNTNPETLEGFNEQDLRRLAKEVGGIWNHDQKY
ncbi:MAG: hypothetical protein V1720_22120 [bacterium]